MSSFINSLVQGTNDKVELKSTVNLGGQAYQVFKQFKESIEPQEIALVIKQKIITGNTMLWGNETYGIWGTAKWGAIASSGFILGSSIAGVLGESTLGSTDAEFKTIRVIPLNNTFTENFLSETFFSDLNNATISGGQLIFG